MSRRTVWNKRPMKRFLSELGRRNSPNGTGRLFMPPNEVAPIVANSSWIGITNGTMRFRGAQFTKVRPRWIAPFVAGQCFGLSRGISQRRP